MALLPHGKQFYLRTPSLVAREDGGATLHAILWDGGGEALIAIELERRAAILALTRTDGVPSVSNDPCEVDRHATGGWRAWIERDAGSSSVWAEDPAGARTLVWRARATAAAPFVAPAGGGAWIAFHHNVREDDGAPDLAKWIALRRVEGGRVLEPLAPMLDRDRDREGEEQSFEMPSLVAGDDGALALFGRGSHAHWRQDVSSAGFGARVRLGEGAWGCRGRWVAATRLADGALLTARRDKQGLYVERAAGPLGGAPECREAQIILQPRAHRGVPSRPRGADPVAHEGRTTLFGDIHQHSAHSDGIGTADEPYLRARYVYGDDFAALTDHESFVGKRIGPGEWAYLSAVAGRHDEPGEFATLIAYEWTGRMYPGPGHKVVYHPQAGLPIVSRDDVPEGKALLEQVRALGGFAVPHHVGWTGAHAPLAQPVWEICSCHGCYLHADHPLGGRGDLRDQMVEAVLRRGKRFGFIACSDGHGLLYHHGVARKRDPFRCGLTAVQARARTREAILEAIRERRCYATSGAPIYLDLRAGNAPMGSELVAGGSIRARARVVGTSKIASLALIGPEGALASADGAGDEAEVEADVGPGWVYARAEQVDGELAWSSPIFLDAR